MCALRAAWCLLGNRGRGYRGGVGIRVEVVLVCDARRPPGGEVLRAVPAPTLGEGEARVRREAAAWGWVRGRRRGELLDVCAPCADLLLHRPSQERPADAGAPAPAAPIPQTIGEPAERARREREAGGG